MVRLKEPSRERGFHFRAAKRYHLGSCRGVCDALTFLCGLALGYVGKLWRFLWVLIVLPSSRVSSRFVMRGAL